MRIQAYEMISAALPVPLITITGVLYLIVDRTVSIVNGPPTRAIIGCTSKPVYLRIEFLPSSTITHLNNRPWLPPNIKRLLVYHNCETDSPRYTFIL
jgi:hypothetical protein